MEYNYSPDLGRRYVTKKDDFELAFEDKDYVACGLFSVTILISIVFVLSI